MRDSVWSCSWPLALQFSVAALESWGSWGSRLVVATTLFLVKSFLGVRVTSSRGMLLQNERALDSLREDGALAEQCNSGRRKHTRRLRVNSFNLQACSTVML
jgi:hypothetical protein